MRRQLLVDAVQLCLVLLCLMRPAANMHIHVLRTGPPNIARRSRQHFGFQAHLRFRLVSLRL